jgi:predicted ribosomally synthesized peptide with SipW-like signal peptide
VGDTTEKIEYEIVINDNDLTAKGSKVAGTFDNISDSAKKSKTSLKDHSDTVDKIIPGFSGMTSGIASATKASLAFIATPIGAVIGALGVAIGAVTAYFKSSEDAENKLAKGTAILGAVFEQLTNFAEDLGEMIVGLFEHPQESLKNFANLIKENLVNRFNGLLELIPQLGKAVELLFAGKFSEAGKVAVDAAAKAGLGVEHATDKIEGFINKVGEAVELGIKNGERLAALQADIDKKQRQLIEDRAKTDIEVIKLREKAITEEGDLKKKTIQEAIDLETALSNKELEVAKLKQSQAKLEVENNGATKEALTKLAEANAAVINAEATRYQNTLRFSKEIEAINKAQEAEDQKAHDASLKRIDDEEKARKNAISDEAKEIEDTQKQFDEADQKYLDSENKKLKAHLDANKKKGDDDKKQAQLDYLLGQQRLSNASTVINQVAGLLDKNSAAYKVLAISQASIDTFRAATAALAPPPIGAGPLFGPILAATTVALGLANIAKISGFAEGGLSGTRIFSGMGKNIYRSNGDNMLATVRTGEVILNERQQAALGGSRTFAAIGVPGFAAGGITDTRLDYSMNNALNTQLNNDRNFDAMINKINSTVPVLVVEHVENLMNQRTEIREQATL